MKKCIRFSLFLALFSFSFHSNAQHCTVVTWDKAQKQHEALEEWYNLSAVQFNELLFRHKSQVFMSKEFTLQELTTFWHPAKVHLHKILEDQIQSALNLATQLSQASTLLSEKIDSINGMTLTWQRLSSHCIEDNLIANHTASLKYVKSAQELKSDIIALMLKIETLEQRYIYEAKVLQDAHFMSDLEFNSKK